jgi:hypothetical protein
MNKSRIIVTTHVTSVTIRTVPRSVLPRLIDWSGRLFVLFFFLLVVGSLDYRVDDDRL